MIDMNKKYTYNGKPVRIYANGNDTAGGALHCAALSYDSDTKDKWYLIALYEEDLVEVREPKEGEWCFFWDSVLHGCHVRKFVKHTKEGYVDSCNVYWVYCSPFTGTLPEAFKGLV